MMDKGYWDKDWLYNEYIVKNRKKQEIAEECGITIGQISSWLRKHGLYKTGHLGDKLVKNNLYLMRYTPKHPFCSNRGYVREHRLIIEKDLGRYLQDKEQVHHIDLVKDHNFLDNLLLCKDSGEHQKIHSQLRKLQKELIRLEIIKFNEKERKYFIDKGRLKVLRKRKPL